MTSKDDIKKQIREWIKLGFIEPKDLPSIELYMDQVTTYMNKRLSANKRTEEDKTLTKTMINNYTKNNLLPPSNKKRYSKEHLILLIYIYYLKSFMSISDIQTMIEPLITDYFDSDTSSHSLEEIYANLYDMEKYQYFNVENSIIKAYQLAEKNTKIKDDAYIQKLNFLSLLSYDIFTKRKLMEKIIDDMKAEAEAKEQAEKEQADAKKNEKKDAKQAAKKAPAKKAPAKKPVAKQAVKKAPAKAPATKKPAARTTATKPPVKNIKK